MWFGTQNLNLFNRRKQHIQQTTTNNHTCQNISLATSFPPASSPACLVLPLCLLSDDLEGDERLENNQREALCLVSHDARLR